MLHGDCTDCCSFALKELHSFCLLRQVFYRGHMHPSLAIKENTWESNAPWIREPKISFLYFMAMQIFSLYKWDDLILREFIPLGKSYWPYRQEKLCVLCLFFSFANLHEDSRIYKWSISNSAWASSSYLSHGSVKIEPYLSTYLYRAL